MKKKTKDVKNQNKEYKGVEQKGKQLEQESEINGIRDIGSYGNEDNRGGKYIVG